MPRPRNRQKQLRPVPRRSVLAIDGWDGWGGSMVRTSDGVCHPYISRWRRRLEHNAWVTHSEVAHATADDPLGPYRFQGIALRKRRTDTRDRDVAHNPTVTPMPDAPRWRCPSRGVE